MSLITPPHKGARITTTDIIRRKGGEPIVSLTAYDAPTASILDDYCDFLLVGDSVGMVVHGLPSTIGVTMEMMILHGQAVMRGAKRALIVLDMPFGSYESSPEMAFENAVRLVQETGVQAVKIESGAYAAATIAFLVARGIPVMAHVGLRPQAVNVTGGFKVKGQTAQECEDILHEAKAAADAGAFAIVVEGVATSLATKITQSVTVPTIGIGASAACDGQILVTQDMLGLFAHTPKFVKKYGDLRRDLSTMVAAFAQEVRQRQFPSHDQLYNITSSDSSREGKDKK